VAVVCELDPGVDCRGAIKQLCRRRTARRSAISTTHRLSGSRDPDSRKLPPTRAHQSRHLDGGWSCRYCAGDLRRLLRASAIMPGSGFFWYRRFVAGRPDHDRGALQEQAWREVLARLLTQTLVGASGPGLASGREETESLGCRRAHSQAICSAGRSMSTTVSTVLQDAWAQCCAT